MVDEEKTGGEEETEEETRKGKSLLFKLKPIVDRIPAIARPEKHVPFNQKMGWVIGMLVFYYIMTNVFLFGLDRTRTVDLFASYRAIMAGAQGTLMHLGIGPIVTGSIIMQLFTGAKIFKLDLKNEEDRAIYQGVQKFVVLIMIAVEAFPQVYGFLNPSKGLIDAIGDFPARMVIFVQLYLGSYMVFLMDEVVSKWGIGSGISLFIAAGVANSIFTGTFNWLPAKAGDTVPSGVLPKTIFFLQQSPPGSLASGSYEELLFGIRYPPNTILALIGTVAIFLIVAYVESMKIEIPLAHGRARGARGRYPIKLMYCSNIPVILMSAVLANISMFALLFWQHPMMSQAWGLGHNWMFGGYPTPAEAEQWGIQQTTPVSGLAYYCSSVQGAREWVLPLIYPEIAPVGFGGVPRPQWQVFIHVLVFVSVMVIGSYFFAKFWIETTNMGPDAVAKQIQAQGLQIPGFRRDPQVIQKVLERYIPTITGLSGILVGLLASGADLIGTVGNASGTGVLLSVGIMIQFYEAMGREQLMEMHPFLRQFMKERG